MRVFIRFFITFFLSLWASLHLYSQYTFVSGGTVNACSGTISLGSYTPGTLYTITICSDDTNNLQLTLTITDYNIGGDQLCAFDGASTASPLIGCSQWGTSQTITTSPVNVTGCITLFWLSNTAGATFSANIQCPFICQPFQVSVTTIPPYITENGINYVDICQGDVVTFNATGIYPNYSYPQSDSTTTFNYDFDNSQTTGGLGMTTAIHTFTGQQGYDIAVTGVDQYNCNSTNAANLRVRVSLPLSFNGVFAVPQDVCTGRPVDLVYEAAVVNDTVTWTNQPVNQIADTTFLPDGSGISYNTSITLSGFNPGATLTTISDLLGICVNMEHSFLGDLTMHITCPNGTQVQLEDQGGGGCFLGAPLGGVNHSNFDCTATPACVSDPAQNPPGTGWDYSWSPSPTYGVMSLEAASYTTLPSGSYASFQSLTSLVGCPLNGQWTITVTDNWGIDNGYIFSWGINFNPLLYSSVWSYNTWITDYSWTAPGATGNYTISTGTNGTGQVEFQSTGSPGTTVGEPILLTVTDNYGCLYDTTIIVNVMETESFSISGLASGYYITDTAVTISGYPAGGTFSGQGIVQPFTFDPAVAGPGIHTIQYDYYYIGATTTTGLLDIFSDDFATDKGWTGYGAGGWERDTATASTGCSGGQDPSYDHTTTADNFIIGNYIGACYPNSMTQTYWLTSPVINCSGMNDCVLDFWSQSGCESSSFDHIYVDVYNGSIWQNIYSNTTGSSEIAWTQRTYIVPQATNNANFQIRFGLGTTDGSVTYQGWNIDDLSLKCNGSITVIDTLCLETYTQQVGVDYPLGVIQNHEINNINIYPNPAGDVLYILSENPLFCPVTLTDITGKVMLIQNASGESTKISLEGIAAGTYFLEISGKRFYVVKN